LSSEDETRKLLKFREDLKNRTQALQEELSDLKKAVQEIDRQIVRSGFRQPTPTRVYPIEKNESVEDDEWSSVKSKNGTTLGSLRIEDGEIVFEPVSGIFFNTSIPPFQSFFIDRVLMNMKAMDEERVARGEASLDDILDFEVVLEGERIERISIHNYGGERRLREIHSSLRWAFDKMYDRLRQD
jgi:hypothetical protein